MPQSQRFMDLAERSERQKTLARRENRRRRRRLFVLGVVVLLSFTLLALPSLISRSPLAHWLLRSTADGYGFDVQADSIRVGWITPLRVTGIRCQGKAAGSQIDIDQIDAGVTALDALATSLTDIGQVTIRGLHIACGVDRGGSSLETDLQTLMNLPTSADPATSGTIRLQDLTVDVTDVAAGKTWRLDQSNADVTLQANSIEVSIAGVLRQPGGSEGSIQGRFGLNSFGRGELVGRLANQADAQESVWWAEVQTETLPVSFVALVKSRFPESLDSVPADMGGDVTGQLIAKADAAGVTHLRLNQVEIRNFEASQRRSPGDAGDRPASWHNELASLNGELVLLPHSIEGHGLRITSDFVAIDFDGAVANSLTLVGSDDNPFRWLSKIDGRAEADLDLARFDAALPGLLPLNPSTRLISGRLRGRIESMPEGEIRRCRLTLRSEQLDANADGRSVRIQPIQLDATVSDDGRHLRADSFQFRSNFASADGGGDLSGGSADITVDFGALAATLQPIIAESDETLRGLVNGNIQWNVDRNNQWRLTGKGRATDLVVVTPNGQTLRRGNVDLNVGAVGTFANNQLTRLASTSIDLSSDGLWLNAELTEPVNSPGTQTPLPIRVRGTGPVETLVAIAGPWLPKSIEDAAGTFRFLCQATVQSDAASITTVDLDWNDARLITPTQVFEKSNITLRFEGDCELPAGNLDARVLSLRSTADGSEAATVAAIGRSRGDAVDMEISWSADLAQLQGSATARLAKSPDAPILQVSFPGPTPAAPDPWFIAGNCTGSAVIKTRDGLWNIETETNATDLAVYQPAAAADDLRSGPRPRPITPIGGGQSDRQRGPQRGRLVWREPATQLRGLLTYDPASGKVSVDNGELATDWFITHLTGHAVWNGDEHDVRLNGPTKLKMDEVAKLLTKLSGTQVQAFGIHETPVSIRVGLAKAGGVAFDIVGDLGWETAEVAGVVMGDSKIPFQMTETTVAIRDGQIPVGEGRINLAGDVNYRPGPLWIRLQPGLLAQSVRVTPDMADDWLKYLAPVVADAARIDGTFGCQIDEAMIVVDDPSQSRVLGSLDIGQVQMLSGPMTSQIISNLDLLRGLATGQAGSDRTNTTLITLPPQQVDFQLAGGVVSHQRLLMQIDRAEVITGGQVGLDGRLKMVAQVPLSDAWLGGDLEILSGQTLSFPIDGTVSRPSLDSRQMTQAMTRAGTQAVKAGINDKIQREWDRGAQKINEELERQFDKLGIPGIFGR